MDLKSDAPKNQKALMGTAQASTMPAQNIPGQLQSANTTKQPANTTAQMGAQQQSKTVVGVFDGRQVAENAVNQLRQQGFTTNEISIVAKQTKAEVSDSFGSNVTAKKEGSNISNNDTISDGVFTGSALGGVGGLMAAAGALAIPGIGPIVALGPIAAVLSGAVAGGVAGGLVDYGIPDESGRVYEARVQEGKVLAVVRSEIAKVKQAAQILTQNGAKDVETH